MSIESESCRQNGSLGEVWSRSSLFAQVYLSVNITVPLPDAGSVTRVWRIETTETVSETIMTNRNLSLTVLYTLLTWRNKEFNNCKCLINLSIACSVFLLYVYEPGHEKTCLRGLRPVKTNLPAQLIRLSLGLEILAIASRGITLSGSEKQRRWSSCADAQADLCLCCSHMAKAGFFMTWLMSFITFCLSYSSYSSLLSRIYRGSYTSGHFIWNLCYESLASFIWNDHECKVLFIVWLF